MLSRQTQIVIQFRGGCPSSRVTSSWRTGRQIAVRVAEHQSVVVVHTVTLRIVEFVLKESSGKTEEGKARLRAAASRVGDAPTGRALKRVRFAADRVEDDTETPEATSASAPSSLPAEDATTNSLPAVLPASAVEVLDQVMSEGTSNASDAAVRLSVKRSKDSPNSESDTQRLHTDHSTRDVVS